MGFITIYACCILKNGIPFTMGQVPAVSNTTVRAVTYIYCAEHTASQIE